MLTFLTSHVFIRKQDKPTQLCAVLYTCSAIHHQGRNYETILGAIQGIDMSVNLGFVNIKSTSPVQREPNKVHSLTVHHSTYTHCEEYIDEAMWADTDRKGIRGYGQE